MRRVLAAVLLLASSTGCTSDDGGPSADRDDHAARLEADREAAREAVRALVPRLEADLVGTVRSASGSYRGCRERTPEGVAAFEYVATARVDAGRAAADDLLATVPQYLPEAVASEVPGGRRISADDGTLTLTVTTRPAAGRFVLLTVVGGCHDVPADEQDAWLDRPVDDLT